jgi:hypothetical protein
VHASVKRCPTYKALAGKRYMACHIRLTDNFRNINRDFGIDAREAISLRRCMQFAEYIRKTDPTIDTLFIATDNKDVVKQIEALRGTGHWHFIYQKGVPRNHLAYSKPGTANFEWFRDASGVQGHSGIVKDVELMSRADYGERGLGLLSFMRHACTCT